jgi:hypothetical protein
MSAKIMKSVVRNGNSIVNTRKIVFVLTLVYVFCNKCPQGCCQSLMEISILPFQNPYLCSLHDIINCIYNAFATQPHKQ